MSVDAEAFIENFTPEEKEIWKNRVRQIINKPFPEWLNPMPKLFEYAIVYIPKQVKDNSGNDVTPDPEVLQDTSLCYAENETGVTVRAAREIPESYLDRLAQVQVIVRPFK